MMGVWAGVWAGTLRGRWGVRLGCFRGAGIGSVAVTYRARREWGWVEVGMGIE